MTTKARTSFLLALVGQIAASQAQLASTAPKPPAPPSPPLSPTEQAIKDIKNPEEWLSWGADLRLRNEYFNSLLTLNRSDAANLNEQDYFRYRARLWTSIKPMTDLSLNARLATEPRTWMKPAGYSPFKGQSGTDWTEGIIDNLNVQYKNILESPVSITVGRQDIFWGDGWLMGDGTPYDGSWTYYLDAARVSYELKEQHTTIEGMGIIQYAKDDYWLPTINNQNRYQMEQNEKGAVLHVLNTSIPQANLDPYFVYKHDSKIDDPKAPKPGDVGDIYTTGARVFGTLSEHWKYSAEGAYQFGEKQDGSVKYPAVSTASRDIHAAGFNGRGTYLFKDQYNQQLTLSYEFLSGDDPNTQEDEMFDVLWGRWPFWSEAGLYSYAAETRVGQQANLHRLGPTYSIDPIKDLNFTVSYYALIAPQEVATRGAVPPSGPLFSNDGNFRGHFVSAILKYKFSRHMTGHLWSEFLFPGNYYVHQDMIPFLRAELFFTF
jgi:hypothetical protein